MYHFEFECTAPTPARWFYVIPMAAATTFGLLLLMFKLVYMEHVYVDEGPEFDIPEVAWKVPPPVEPIRKELVKPKDLEEPPPTPRIETEVDNKLAIDIPKSSYEGPKPEAKIGFNVNAPIEHFIVTPHYPSRAITKGIEGYVELRFDVNKAGATENIEVVRSEPKGIFEDAAVAAAVRWKFQPKTEDGKPVYFRGLSKLVTFEMQKT